MAGRLVTIATFDQAAQARLAENALKEAGIQAAVSDETLVAMDWLLSGAVGGVKVQVWEEDAERAVAVLENQFGANGEGFGGADVAPEELAAQAEATADGEEEPERLRAVRRTRSARGASGRWKPRGVRQTVGVYRDPRSHVSTRCRVRAVPVLQRVIR